ncbi:MAG: hypothetical protein HKP40_07080 [Litoreibacter sp.]|nr:hypothetical protein [Litoreibacter sp.]
MNIKKLVVVVAFSGAAMTFSVPAFATGGCDCPPAEKGNNGWGNGDQPAPGNSGNSNRAENGAGATNRNHGNANPD